MLTVCVAVTDSSWHAREDAGGGFRAVDSVPRREEATAPLLARTIMAARSVALTTRRLICTGYSEKGFGVVAVAVCRGNALPIEGSTGAWVAGFL